jgi:YHS domain-containing protein
MKTTIQILGGLAAATLLLSSCGDKKTTTTEPETPAPAAAAAAAAADDYPLDVCPVSGEKLGEMGKPVVVTHEGTEVRLCCKDCLPKFKADPAKYVEMVKTGNVEHAGHDH